MGYEEHEVRLKGLETLEDSFNLLLKSNTQDKKKYGLVLQNLNLDYFIHRSGTKDEPDIEIMEKYSKCCIALESEENALQTGSQFLFNLHGLIRHAGAVQSQREG
jgi:hypothetical protein